MQVYLKDESDRYGLPAFKVLGAAYASYVTLCERWDTNVETSTLEQLRAHVRQLKSPSMLVAATDGNHGRAIAFFANLLGLEARIYIPWTVSEGSEKAIDGEGAGVTVVRCQLDYDECVKLAADFAAAEHDDQGQERVLIQDTAWEGYTHIPHLIVDGYQTIFYETEQELASCNEGSSTTTHVICPVGVGSLAQAAVQYYTSDSDPNTATPTRMVATLIAVEPSGAACLAESIASDKLTSVQTGDTIMAGLNCGTPSLSAWPYLQAGIHAVVKREDQHALDASRWLRESGGIEAGPCGAAPLAALQALLDDTATAERLGLLDNQHVKILLLMTEGSLPT